MGVHLKLDGRTNDHLLYFKTKYYLEDPESTYHLLTYCFNLMQK